MNEEPRLQSGVIPYRRTTSGQIEILLITSRQTGEWQVPKGDLEPGMSESVSAAQEGREEAGVQGTPEAEPTGSYLYQRKGERRRVLLYPMEVDRIEDGWEEQGQRERRWVTGEQALRDVSNPDLRQVLRGFLEQINRSGSS